MFKTALPVLLLGSGLFFSYAGSAYAGSCLADKCCGPVDNQGHQVCSCCAHDPSTGVFQLDQEVFNPSTENAEEQDQVDTPPLSANL